MIKRVVMFLYFSSARPQLMWGWETRQLILSRSPRNRSPPNFPPQVDPADPGIQQRALRRRTILRSLKFLLQCDQFPLFLVQKSPKPGWVIIMHVMTLITTPREGHQESSGHLTEALVSHWSCHHYNLSALSLWDFYSLSSLRSSSDCFACRTLLSSLLLVKMTGMERSPASRSCSLRGPSPPGVNWKKTQQTWQILWIPWPKQSNKDPTGDDIGFLCTRSVL